jgi:hypothetical protein
MEGEDEVCYWSGTLDEFTHKDPSVKWVRLMTNSPKYGGPEEDHNAGMIGIQVTIK